MPCAEQSVLFVFLRKQRMTLWRGMFLSLKEINLSVLLSNVCVCTRACVHLHTCAHTHVCRYMYLCMPVWSPKVNDGCSPPSFPFYYSETGSHWSQSSPFWLDWRASNYQWSSIPRLHSAGIARYLQQGIPGCYLSVQLLYRQQLYWLSCLTNFLYGVYEWETCYIKGEDGCGSEHLESSWMEELKGLYPHSWNLAWLLFH